MAGNFQLFARFLFSLLLRPYLVPFQFSGPSERPSKLGQVGQESPRGTKSLLVVDLIFENLTKLPRERDLTESGYFFPDSDELDSNTEVGKFGLK